VEKGGNVEAATGTIPRKLVDRKRIRAFVLGQRPGYILPEDPKREGQNIKCSQLESSEEPEKSIKSSYYQCRTARGGIEGERGQGTNREKIPWKKSEGGKLRGF